MSAPETMRAVRYERFGTPSVLRVAQVPVPTPGPGEALVRVHASALNPKDILIRRGKLRLFTRGALPRTPGYDFAGVVEAVAPGVASVAVGDEVFGMRNGWAGGACAEYVCAAVTELARKPANLTMVQAASIPLAALTALQALRDALELAPGMRVCVNGASGGVGTQAVQIARALGAQVTAVCSARNADLVRDLGAHDVIDYATDDPLSRRWDAIFDVFGSLPYARARHALHDGARHVTTIPTPRHVLAEALARVGGPQARLVIVESRRPDLEHLATWLADGTIRPVVDRVYTLEDSAAAHAYIETKRARGKVVLASPPQNLSVLLPLSRGPGEG